MKEIIIPKQTDFKERSVDEQKIKAYIEHMSKAPSIKEQLVLRAYEMTDSTKVFYDSEDVMLLYSTDETGTFLSCFNKSSEMLNIELPLAAMHLMGEYTAFCVLTAENICVLDGIVNLHIPDSGVLLVKLVPVYSES